MPEFALPLVLLALPLGLPARLLTVRQRVPAAALREPRATAMLLTDRIGVRRRTRWDTALAAALWCLLVIAIANPRVPGQTLALPVSGRDIILTLDLSGSMKDTDFELDGQPIARIDAVKRVATNLVLRRGGDRIGLVVFADHPYFAAPLTFDMPALARTIDHATIGISGNSTAIADGLGLALRRLSRSEAKSRVIVLLSDGADNASTVLPAEAGALAARLGVRIYAIALGPHDLATHPDDPDAVDAEALGALLVAASLGWRVSRGRLGDWGRAVDRHLMQAMLRRGAMLARCWRDRGGRIYRWR